MYDPDAAPEYWNMCEELGNVWPKSFKDLREMALYMYNDENKLD
jgi:hypothetical protein